MFTKGFGEILVDALTVNPALKELPSVSAILDTSNYTFNAITYGKDAEGFNLHGHTVSDTQYVNGVSASGVSGYNNGYIFTVNYRNTAPFVSSYEVSTTQLQFSSTYNSVPAYPSVAHTRLESESTQTTAALSYSATPPDLGHYPNAWVDSDLSSIWNILGGFAPPSSVGAVYQLLDSNGTQITSGVLSGMYNQNGVIDKDGYIKISETSGLNSTLGATQGAELVGGPVVFSATGGGQGPTEGITNIAVVPQYGDSATLALFGGVNHIGVHCLDLRSMLELGITPPFSWDALNNNRKYKMVAKVTILDNLMKNYDVGGAIAGLSILNEATSTSNKGPTFILKFNFL